MKPPRQRWLLAVYFVLVTAFIVSFLVQCSRGWPNVFGSTRIVEQFDNGPVPRDGDDPSKATPRPSEGYRRVPIDADPPPGKNWRTINPNDLSPEKRKRLP